MHGLGFGEQEEANAFWRKYGWVVITGRQGLGFGDRSAAPWQRYCGGLQQQQIGYGLHID